MFKNVSDGESQQKLSFLIVDIFPCYWNNPKFLLTVGIFPGMEFYIVKFGNVEMTLPNILRRTLDDLERRYTGPIPSETRFEACLPASITLTNLAEIESCLEYFCWLCRSRWLQLKATAKWAARSRGDAGLTAISDREKFRIASRRLIEARLARDAWLKARRNYLGSIK